MSQRLSLIINAAVLAVSASTAAANEAFVVRVVYEAPAGCPTENEFLHQVLRRAHRARLAEGTEPAREFRAVITQDSNNEIGARLQFVDSDLHSVSREIDGSRCDEVVSALALITALAIDPLLSVPTRQRPADSVESEPAPKNAQPEPHSSTAPTQRAETPETPRTVQPRAEPVLPSVGIAFGTASGAAPEWAPTLTLFSEFSSRRRGVVDEPRRRGVVDEPRRRGMVDEPRRRGMVERPSSALRFELSYSETTSSSVNSASAVFRLATSALEGCPWSAELLSGLRLWPCAAIEAGVFHAAGLASPRLPHPSSATTPWLAGDAVLRATVDLSRHFDLELGGKARVPLIRHTYVYEKPLTQAYKTPSFGAVIYLGIGLRFGG